MATANARDSSTLGAVPVQAATLSPRCHRPRRPWQQPHEQGRHALLSARVVAAAPPLLGSKRPPAAAARVLCSRAPRPRRGAHRALPSGVSEASRRRACLAVGLGGPSPQMGPGAGSTHAALNPRDALSHVLRHRASWEGYDASAPLCVRSMRRASSKSERRCSSSAERLSPSPGPRRPPQRSALLPRRRLLPQTAPEQAAEVSAGTARAALGDMASAPSSPRCRGAVASTSAVMRGCTEDQGEPADVESMCLEGTRAIRTPPPRSGEKNLADGKWRPSSTKGVQGCVRGLRGAPSLAPAGASPSAPARVATSKRAGRLAKKRHKRLVLPFAYDDDDPRIAHLESVAGMELPQFWTRSAAWPPDIPPPPPCSGQEDVRLHRGGPFGC
ncbi:unnamed protein product [Prorocentrum cordatum]|uniref:Uncharacterized protein n=1 Tax=Prorocentrum cordatum TaxID=2364126 RepID=A0ABN9YC20_9DINO|nr:unnamed protein product [Polarella glacialis]